MPGTSEMYEYTHLIAEAKSKFSPNLKPYASTHDIIDTIEAFHQLSFNYFTIPPIKIRTRPVLFILKRRENYREFLDMRNYEINVFKNETESKEEETPAVEEVSESEEKNLVAEKIDISVEKMNKGFEAFEEVELKQNVTIVEEHLVKDEDNQNKSKDEEKIEVETRENLKKVKRNSESILNKKITKIEDNKALNSTEERQTVKRNIKKLIQKYRRKKENDGDPVKTVHAKDTIKKIIEEEKMKQTEEELTKVQQQIFDIIETNPNIINKKLIKQRLRETITSEFMNIKPKKLKIDDKKIEKERRKTKLSIEEKIEDKAVDFYEPAPEEIPKLEVESEEKLTQMSEKFLEASKKIADIMTIIDEIVDTMEISEDSE